MKEKEIKVLKVVPEAHPQIVILKNDLASLQEAVSIGADYRGSIEIVELDEDTCILCNEEGKLIGLKPNRRLGRDILCGVFYVTGQDKQGNLASIKESSLQKYGTQFFAFENISAEEVDSTVMMEFRML